MLRNILGSKVCLLTLACHCTTIGKKQYITYFDNWLQVHESSASKERCVKNASPTIICASQRSYSTVSYSHLVTQRGISNSSSCNSSGGGSNSSSIPQFRCGNCNKTFRLLNALQHHIMTKHAGDAKVLKNVEGVFVELGSETDKDASIDDNNLASSQSDSNNNNQSGNVKGNVNHSTLSTKSSDSENSVQSNARESGQTATSLNTNRHPTSSFTGGYAGTPTQSKMSGGAVPNFPGIFPSTITTHTSANFSGNCNNLSNEIDDREVPEKNVSEESEESSNEQRQYICNICQKVFRMEAALQHHYQAKHNVEMPSSSSSSSTVSSTFGQVSSSFSTNNITNSMFTGAPHHSINATGSGEGIKTGNANAPNNIFATSSNGFYTSQTAMEGDDLIKQDTLHSTQYIRQQPSTSNSGIANEQQQQQQQQQKDAINVMKPAQYHLSVAPHAPESGDIACH